MSPADGTTQPLGPHRLQCLVGSIALWSFLRALVRNRNQEMIPSVNANPISMTSDSHIYRRDRTRQFHILLPVKQNNLLTSKKYHKKCYASDQLSLTKYWSETLIILILKYPEISVVVVPWPSNKNWRVVDAVYDLNKRWLIILVYCIMYIAYIFIFIRLIQLIALSLSEDDFYCVESKFMDHNINIFVKLRSFCIL